MSRVACKAVLLGGLVLGILASASGCSVQATVKTQTRFEENGVAPASVPTEDWAGEKIVIRDEAAGVVAGTALEVKVDPNATKVTAVADMVALADDDDRANANLSIADAKTTFKIVKEGDVWNVVCGHGGAHGSSSSGGSGCEHLSVTIPAGSDAKKIALETHTGNGAVNVDVSSVTLEALEVHGHGPTTVRSPTTKDSTILVIGEESSDVSLLLPSSFAADKIELDADADKITNSVSDVQLTDAGGVKTGSRGTAGTGSKSIKVQSVEFAGSTGKVALGTF